jgi:hypothetical protein
VLCTLAKNGNLGWGDGEHFSYGRLVWGSNHLILMIFFEFEQKVTNILWLPWNAGSANLCPTYPQSYPQNSWKSSPEVKSAPHVEAKRGDLT